MIHTNEKPFKCNLCTLVFNRKSTIGQSCGNGALALEETDKKEKIGLGSLVEFVQKIL